MPGNRIAAIGATALWCVSAHLSAQVAMPEAAPAQMTPPVVRNNTRRTVTCEPISDPGRPSGAGSIVLRPGEEKVLDSCELSILPGRKLDLKPGRRYSILRDRRTGAVGLYEIGFGQ